MGLRRNKRGSFTIYAAVIAAAMSIFVSALVSASMNMYIEGVVPAMGRLHAASILGEYDSELYDRYGIMGFYGSDSLVTRKLELLADYSFEEKPFIDCEVSEIDLYSYSLGDQNVFFDQINLIGLENLATSVLGSRGDYLGSQVESLEGVGRTLLSDRVIRGLPSFGRVDDSILDSISGVLKGVGSPKELIKSGTESFLINQYISAKFGDARNLPHDDKSYLLFEREYIVAGNFSDAENLASVKRRIIAMREVVNLAFLESDKKMRTEATAIGQILTLGHGGEVSTQAVMLVWAYIESLNDYELLIHGKKVPGIKDHYSWATDRNSVLNGWNGDYIDMECQDGDTYSDYLSLLTYLLPRDTKLLRIMDLIQINLRYYYRSDFLLSEHFTGLDYSLLVNGKEYYFSDSYGKR